MTQNFKGDSTELKYQAAGEPAFEVTRVSLHEFFQGCYDTDAFLLMLYDSGRMPFSNRVPREAFVNFIRQAIPDFPATGTFEVYIFMIKALFGDSASILFTVPAAGKLEIEVNAPGSSLEFDWFAKDIVGGDTILTQMVTHDSEEFLFNGISGIETEAQLQILLGELEPIGIYTTLSLTFFQLFQFVANYDGTGIPLYTMLDSFGNEIVFYEP
jgi:hypothetical protein